MNITIQNMVKFMLVLPTLFLSGCASMNSDFDCPMKPGVMCKSLDSVNGMVDKGQLGANAPKTPCKDCDKSDPSDNDKASSNDDEDDEANNFTTPFPSKMGIQPGDPLRYSENVMEIWVAPYEDTQGNYHQESAVFTVVQPGHWIGSPVKALASDWD